MLTREEHIELVKRELQEVDRNLTAVETAIEAAEEVIEENEAIYDTLLYSRDQIIVKRFELRKELRDVIES